MCDVISNLIKTDITAIKFVHNKIFAGIGGYLHIYGINPTLLVDKIKIFDNNVIHGIVANQSLNMFLIHGANEIKFFTYNENFVENSSHLESDWILCTKWLNEDKFITLLTIHNKIILYTQNFSYVKTIVCQEQCILYSAALINETWDELIILSGTVFNQILIWWPSHCKNIKCNILRKLNGHNGVIFSISYNKNNGLICSTSDDRSAILWLVKNKNLTVELKQANIDIQQKCIVHGHSSRIFRCLVLKEYFITAGEDSKVNLWDFNGNLIKKIETSNGNVIWAVDCDKDENNIAVGGSSCGITLLTTKIQRDVLKISLEDQEVVKQIGLLKSGSLIVICESGLLKRYSYENDNGIWVNVMRHDEFKTYAILEMSFNREFFILAGFRGHIIVYKETDSYLKNIVRTQVNGDKRIFSVHWLTNCIFLICLPDGELQLWYLWNKPMVMYKYKLPRSKEPWSTAACLLNQDYFAVGDRKGSVYLYKLTETDGHPVQIISKVHNYLGVTHLYEQNGNLISLGRNSTINTYVFDTSINNLVYKSSDKTPFTWLAALKIETSMLLAFSANNFILWDCNSRQTLWEFDCGGGHRSWNFEKSSTKYIFAFIKDKSIYQVVCPISSIIPTEIVGILQSKEINSICCISYMEDSRKCLLVCGGEDTNLRFFEVDFVKNPYEFRTLSNFKSHLSSIRAITSCEIEKTTKCEVHLVFSAGGRAQIILWKVCITFRNRQLNISCSEQHSYYETITKNESEIRFMNLNSQKLNNCVILFAACSDGNIKLFAINLELKQKYSLIHLTNIFYASKCILKLNTLYVSNQHILCSMATDGKIAIWNVNSLLGTLIKENKIIIESDFKLKTVALINTQQSGINSCSYKILSDDKCIFITGGDDNAVVISLLQFKNKNNLSVEVLKRIQILDAHCAQVTGIYIAEQYFITASIDQKITFFKWNVTGSEINYNKICVHMSHIPDIQGMLCFKINKSVDVILHGKGIEMLNCNLELG